MQNKPPLSDLNFGADRQARPPQKSKHIKGIKIALPLLAITMTAATIFWTFIASEDIELQATQQILGVISKNELLNPRFESTDNQGQPFTITASRAVRGETDDGLIMLTDPSGDIMLESGRWLAVRAGEGAYNQDKKRLILRENVNIYDDQGYTMETKEMNIDLNEETMQSNTSVFAQGPSGAINAEGFYNNNKTGLLSFNGPASLAIYTKTSQSGLKDLR